MRSSTPPTKTPEADRESNAGADTAQNSRNFKPNGRVLHLNLKAEYFDQIASGEKPFEYRLCTPFWTKRLVGKQFDQVHIKKGYPNALDQSRVIVRPWRGYELQTITHPHFGVGPVQVYAIAVHPDTPLKVTL